MKPGNYSDLVAFLAVAEDRSFTRAAARLGVSQSALSHTIRALEEELGVQLLSRTTRSVAPTDAGERLVRNIGPRLEEIAAELSALSHLRAKPAGTVRITCAEHAARTVLWPRLEKFLHQHADIRIEIIVDNGLTDIVAERMDAGIRLGEQIAKDMIAIPIGPQQRSVVVGSPAYFKRHSMPKVPSDLTHHNCINVRLPTRGGIYAWEFERKGRELRVRVDGQLVLNDLSRRIDAVLGGLGIGYFPEDIVVKHIGSGRLVQVLDDWCPAYSGYHIYYPSRRNHTPAFAAVLDALRWSKPLAKTGPN